MAWRCMASRMCVAVQSGWRDHHRAARAAAWGAAADVPANDKAMRILNSVTFEAVLAGAIHATTINGVVRV